MPRLTANGMIPRILPSNFLHFCLQAVVFQRRAVVSPSRNAPDIRSGKPYGTSDTDPSGRRPESARLAGELQVIFARMRACLALGAILATATPARAQHVELQAFEVTPFLGVRFGGTFDIQTDEPSQAEATLKDAASYGLSAGVRFDDLSLIEFRWTQSTSALRFDARLRPPGASLGDVTLHQFHADFTREVVIREVKGLRSFLTGSVGATHLAAANDGFTRFSFGLGAGLKQFLGSKLAIRAEAHWLPIWIEPEVGTFACGTVGVGGCLVVLTGRLTQQFELSIGPVVRF